MIETILVVAAFVANLFVCFKLWQSNKALSERIVLLESVIEQEDQEKKDFKKSLKVKYEGLFQEAVDSVNKELSSVKKKANVLVDSNHAEFQKKLELEFEKACAKISFSEIEYKKTITKKRQQFSRKNAKNAKPQRIWRYIDEDETKEKEENNE